MPDSERSVRRRGWLAFGLLLILGLATRLPDLGAPLLEGAAGKQAHTAMVARNLFRGLGSWARPVVDDVGSPGYFVKELPLVPALAAAVYSSIGRVDERVGRLIGILSWLAGLPILLALLVGTPTPVRVLAGLWFVLAPIGIAYSRAFMNDPALVSVSLSALLCLERCRIAPTTGRAAAAGALVGLALLLKPHAFFWLVPAGALLVATPRPPAARSSGRDGDGRVLLACLAVGAAVASAWYVHAARVHLTFPVHGATTAEGWVDPHLLLRADLYREIVRQTVEMVFTPVGVALAAVGLIAREQRRSPVERALLAWGAGVLVQCLVFGTRMLDGYSRGTEYYQLALVPVAGVLIGRGVMVAGRLAGKMGRILEPACYAIAIVLIWASAVSAAREAMRPPERYDMLLADCHIVQRVTARDDEIVVLADRSGVVHYYCDRRGSAFALPATVPLEAARVADRAAQLRAFARARYVYVPFPELLAPSSAIAKLLAQEWQRVDTPERELHLYERRVRR